MVEEVQEETELMGQMVLAVQELLAELEVLQLQEVQEVLDMEGDLLDGITPLEQLAIRSREAILHFLVEQVV